MIRTTLQNFNVDENFIWLAMLESGGSEIAISERGAVGLWQLTAPTARNNGCPANQRTEPECSTTAAARYLSKLLAKFNNNVWDAIVGYNMGGSNYKRIGKPTGEARNLANTVTCLIREMPLETWYVETGGEQ
jgi:membrane-bound lytic murein transglycosylase D